jgi:uncharacterized protein YndB with AHSA1/START domain
MTVAEEHRIDRSITIKASPERVWRALTTPAELSAWFKVQIEGELAPNTEVWMTSTHAGYEGQRFHVRIVELSPPHRLVWQWHPGEVDPNVDYSREPRTTVTFALEPVAGGTKVNLSETGFDAIALARRAKVFADNSQGWAEVLGWLQQYAEQAR